MVDGNAGKGSKYRPIDQKKWDEGWETAFGQKSKKKSPGVVEPGEVDEIPNKEKENENE